MGLSKNEVFDMIKEDLAALEEDMLSVVRSPAGLIADIGVHLVEAGGKRLRPALYFLAVRCDVAQPPNVLPLAVAIEMIHMATLVHDDVIDAADMRRGIPTTNAKWGNQLAVLSGDYLFAKAFSLVAKARYAPRVVEILSEVICDLSEGEIIQNKETFIPTKDQAIYETRIAKKTADFIAASCQLGGIVANLPENEIEALRRYGHAIGMAFQITDDILDVTATAEQIGKPAGNDLLQGITTLPAIRALAVSPDAAELEKILATRGMDQATLARGLQIIHATDAVAYSYERVKAYLDEARTILPETIPADVRRAYGIVAEFIATRGF